MIGSKTYRSVTAACQLVAGRTVAAEPPAKPADAGVAAFVKGQPITLAELDAQVLATDMRLAQSLYDARRSGLDQLIMERLLGPEAAEKGVTVDELVHQRVNEKLQPVTDADVENFFNANKSRMGGRTLEQLSGQIRNYLASQRENEARSGLLKELKGGADVRVVLDAPRAKVIIDDNDPSVGPPDAKVTIVEYSDFQWPYCARVGPTLKQIQETYGDKVRIVFRDYALPNHTRAGPAAEAAQCAREQGKFWEYHDKIFENQRSLADEDLKRFATELELDAEKFNECYSSGKYRNEVQEDAREGAQVGVTGTPAFFINGRFLSGAQPFESFKSIIDDELER